MPRKTSPSSARATANTSLALSELHLRLEGLEQERQSLLKQIKKKRTELNNFVSQMRTVATEIFHRIAPNYEKIAEIDREIHALFQEVLTAKKLGKQTKKEVEAIYRLLQIAGIVSPKIDSPDTDTELDELFEPSNEEDNFSQETRENRYQHRDEPDAPSGSASRNDTSRKIRQTFLKLAEIFHPDKVTDSETQMRHTEIMKEINKAYQEGDIARLLEIEQKYQVGEVIDGNSENDLTRKCALIEQQNQSLKSQYENLKRELRLVKNTPEGAMVSDYRKAVKQKIDIVAEIQEQVESQIAVVAEIRDFIKDFRDRKITVKEFMRGPKSLRNLQQRTMEDALEEMFGDISDILGL